MRASGLRGAALAMAMLGTGAAAQDETPAATPADAAAGETPTIPVDPAVAVPTATAPDAASPPAASPGLGVNEIVVTAQRREQAADDIPIAISAFGGDDLQALGVTDTRDLAKIVPGFTAADSGGNTPVYTLRGVGFNDQTYTATSTVGVYVDEVPLPYAVMTKGANLDLQRVEVLKGPQGTLYGRNTTGGAINYIANKPTDDLEAGVTAGYGRFGASDLEGFLSGPLLDTLQGRVAVRDEHASTGWQHSNTRPGDRLGRVDKQSARGLLDWHPADDLAVSLAVSGWRDGSDAQAPQAIYLQPQNAQLGAAALAPQVRSYPLVDPHTDDMQVADWEPNTDWELDDRFWNASLRADWNLDDTSTVTAIYAHGDMKSDGDLLPQSGLDVYNAEQALFASVKTDSLELRLAGTIGDTVNWLVGVNGAHDDGHELHQLFTDTVSSLFPDPLTGESTLDNRVDTYGDNKADTVGIFASGDWAFLDTLRLSLGARYSDEKRRFQGCTYEDPDSQGAGLAPVIGALALTRGNVLLIRRGDCFTLDAHGSNALFHGTLKEDSFSWRAALDWTPIDDLLLYASLTRGFKSGGFPVLNASDQSQYDPVKQERVLAGEVGGKMSFLDRKARVAFALFDYGYDDKQLLTRKQDPIFGPVPVLRNAPKSKVRGAELDGQWSPLAGLFLSASASYIDTKILRFAGTGFDGSAVDFAGRPFNFAPLLQYTLLGDYGFAVLSDHEAGLGADFSYTAKTNSTLEGNPHYAQRAYGLLNARLRFGAASKRWTLTAWGRNLTDEFSQVSIFNIGDAVARYAGMPRTYGVTFEWRTP